MSDFWKPATAGSRPLTADMLRRAVDIDAQRAMAAAAENAARARHLADLDLDLDLLSEHERHLVALAYAGHIFHPRDYEDLVAALKRGRRR